jgi:hypothetical protein
MAHERDAQDGARGGSPADERDHHVAQRADGHRAETAEDDGDEGRAPQRRERGVQPAREPADRRGEAGADRMLARI